MACAAPRAVSGKPTGTPARGRAPPAFAGVPGRATAPRLFWLVSRRGRRGRGRGSGRAAGRGGACRGRRGRVAAARARSLPCAASFDRLPGGVEEVDQGGPGADDEGGDQRVE